MKSCVIIGAGEFNAESFVLPPDSLLIAADAGFANFSQLGLTPDITVGDFDSLGSIPEGGKVIRLPVEKDDTDMSCAIKTACSEGCDVFHIYGGTGGRLDHTLANIQLLIGLSKSGIRAYLYGSDYIVTAITDSTLRFGEKMKGIISVFSADSEAYGVYEKGLKYALDNAHLTNTFPVGVSNEFTGAQAEVSVKSGTLIIIYAQS